MMSETFHDECTACFDITHIDVAQLPYRALKLWDVLPFKINSHSANVLLTTCMLACCRTTMTTDVETVRIYLIGLMALFHSVSTCQLLISQASKPASAALPLALTTTWLASDVLARATHR